MENQIIKVDDLLVGDQIIFACGSALRRVKITRPMKETNNRQWGGMYSSAKVDILNAHDLEDDEVVKTMYQDLNYRDLWLIKRETI